MDRLKAETGSDPLALDLDEEAREELPDTDAEPVPNTPPDPEDDLLAGNTVAGDHGLTDDDRAFTDG